MGKFRFSLVTFSFAKHLTIARTLYSFIAQQKNNFCKI